MIILTLRQLPDDKLQMEERALCFAVYYGKGKYSEYTHDAETILAHYQVDKPFKHFYKL